MEKRFWSIEEAQKYLESQGPKFGGYLHTIVARIGTSGRRQLAWIIEVIKKPSMTPGESIDRPIELAVLCGVGYGEKPEYRGFEAKSGTVVTPSYEETEEIFQHIRQVFQRVINRKDIQIKPSTGGGKIFWSQKDGRFKYWEGREEGWMALVNRVLKDLILEYGHLIKECPAPAIRGKEREICGNWFLATRPNQIYCSARCQTRTTTRAARDKKGAAKVTNKSSGQDKVPKDQGKEDSLSLHFGPLREGGPSR